MIKKSDEDMDLREVAAWVREEPSIALFWLSIIGLSVLITGALTGLGLYWFFTVLQI